MLFQVSGVLLRSLMCYDGLVWLGASSSVPNVLSSISFIHSAGEAFYLLIYLIKSFHFKISTGFYFSCFASIDPSFTSCIDFLVYFVYLDSLIHLVYCVLLILLNILTVVLLNLSESLSKSLWWNPLLWNCLGFCLVLVFRCHTAVIICLIILPIGTCVPMVTS